MGLFSPSVGLLAEKFEKELQKIEYGGKIEHLPINGEFMYLFGLEDSLEIYYIAFGITPHTLINEVLLKQMFNNQLDQQQET